jgi:hypothetical protein
MPNWCNNYVELEHNDPVMISRAAEALGKGELLKEFIPVPTDLQIDAGNVGEKGSPEQVAHELQVEQNIAKHGYADWYAFCVAEWGTKWDLGGDGCEVNLLLGKSGNKLMVSVDSAWAPPIAAFEKLEELGFTVKAMYHESGMGFAGVYSDGNDDYYEFDSLSPDDVEDMLPTELNQFFNISADLAMWEEENEEIDLDGGLSATNE